MSGVQSCALPFCPAAPRAGAAEATRQAAGEAVEKAGEKMDEAGEAMQGKTPEAPAEPTP